MYIVWLHLVPGVPAYFSDHIANTLTHSPMQPPYAIHHLKAYVQQHTHLSGAPLEGEGGCFFFDYN